jgi:CheY-like chemotaxis protein
MAQKKYDIIILDPDAESRMRLRQVTAATGNFGETIMLVDTNDALSKIGMKKQMDIVFISHALPKEEFASFVANAKKLAAGQDCAYVAMMRSENQEPAKIAMLLAQGADGFLVEPYSVDGLSEITNLATRIKRERAGQREELSMRMVLKEVAHLVNMIAVLQALNHPARSQQKKLREMMSTFDNMDEEKRSRYLPLMMESFESAPLPKNIGPKTKYGGASDRIKKKMAEKIVAELSMEEPPT